MYDSDEKPKTYWSSDEARHHIKKYCVYQDRCHKEVRSKLLEHGVYGDLLEEIISELIQEAFLDEERFAKSYARGKFRMKNWGRIKITQELKFRSITDYCIRSAMKEIDEREYLDTLLTLIKNKDKSTSFKNGWDRKKKLTDFAVRKGYEYELINEVLASI